MNKCTPRAHLMRRNLTSTALALLFVAVLAFGFISGEAQSPPGEREIEMKAAAHLPIKIKVKKPEKVKDLKNEDWLGDLEVEVTNTGSKPIYHFYIALIMEDVLVDDEKAFGYQLVYGRGQLADVYEPVRSDDVPLLPGESTVLKLEDSSVRFWKSQRANGKFREAKKLRLSFQWLSHGDGTGFLGPHGVPIPNKRRGSQKTCPDEGDKRGGVYAKKTNAPPGDSIAPHASTPFLTQPVSFLTGNFFSPAGRQLGRRD